MRASPARAAAAAGLAALTLTGCGGGGVRTPATTVGAGQFAYDAAAPLAPRDRGVANPDYPIEIRNVSFASPRGGRVTAYLVLPPGGGRHPAIVYLHGSGGNRLELLAPATWMAARGAVALAVDSPEARSGHPPPAAGLAGLKAQRNLAVKTVVELRRAVDYLTSRPEVDAKRLAFVGYSAGARSGAILAGVEHRYRAFDLMSGGAVPVQDYVSLVPADLKAPVRRLLHDVDPLRYVRSAAPSQLLFQDGRSDRIVPHSALVALYRAASRPKRIRWYAAGHNPSDAAFRDQLAWLSARLGLDGPTVAHVKTGP